MVQVEQRRESPTRVAAVLSPSIVSGLVAMGDVVIILGSGFIIYLLCVDWSGERLPLYLSMMALGTFFTLTAFHFAGGLGPGERVARCDRYR